MSDKELQNDEDFYGDDGLLYCGKCRSQKEYALKMLSGEVLRLPCMCKCATEKENTNARKREYFQTMERINVLKKSSLIESKYKNAKFASFIRTDDNRNLYETAKKYVDDFVNMFDKNQGIIFWGEVGTGKSYTAACIANELLDRMVPVVMTSFVKLLQRTRELQLNETEYIERIDEADLLIIDDLGAERNTDYALEKVYNIIDSRYRTGKPLILTTNMTIGEMKSAADIRYKRIYDRVFEMCYPIEVKGKSWRKVEAAKRYAEMKRYMEE